MTLPFVDEHTIDTTAARDDVWRALVAGFGRERTGAQRYARVVRTDPGGRSGAFPALGASVAGFRVAEVRVGEVLELSGQHRFSRYTLTFVLEPHDDGTRLRAVTHASFPGAAGRVYRALVITSGMHQVMVRRTLRGVVARAAP